MSAPSSVAEQGGPARSAGAGEGGISTPPLAGLSSQNEATDPSRPALAPPARGLRLAEAALGLALLLLAGVIFFEITRISGGPGYARVGPKAFPRLVAIGLLLVGGGLVLAAFRDPSPKALPAMDWRALLFAMAGMLGAVLLFEPGGFAVASAVLVALTARAFGSRRPLLDAAVGFGLGLACLVVFSLGLGVTLPWGPFGSPR